MSSPRSLMIVGADRIELVDRIRYDTAALTNKVYANRNVVQDLFVVFQSFVF